MIFQLVYTSAATAPLSKADFQDIAISASHKNHEKDITGVLIYHNGTLLQVLEGEEDKVRSLYERIKFDPRHNHCTLLASRHGETREFPRWDMFFHAIDSDKESDMFFELTRLSLETPGHTEPADELDLLAERFDLAI